MAISGIEPFRSPAWLRGQHAQTIFPALLGSRPQVTYRRERWASAPDGREDGDFVDIDWVDAPRHARPDTPVVVLFHGLEGSSRSRYARLLMGHVQALGWHGAVPHFRGCSGEPNLAPRFYHSGDSSEADWILQRIAARHPGAPLYAAGVSLGGNVLLKWLGERGRAAARLVRAAVSVSAPIDLAAGGKALSSGFNMLYTREFLRTLKPKCLHKLEQFPTLYDRSALLAARDLYEFDNIVTAPLHGFRDTDDYWKRASSKPLLVDIAVPTLLLNARNDPFMPASVLPTPAQVGRDVVIDYPESGGHVGFIAASGSDWLARRVLDFFQQVK